MGNAEAEGLPIYADNVMRKLMEKLPSAAVCSAADSDDETLLTCLQASDMEALGVLFQRYADLMLSIARRVLRDNDEAEDLVQDVFLFLFLKSKSFDPAKGSARSWLMQVTYHRAYDRRRYLCARSFYDRARSGLRTFLRRSIRRLRMRKIFSVGSLTLSLPSKDCRMTSGRR